MRTAKFKTLFMAGMFLCLAAAGWAQGNNLEDKSRKPASDGLSQVDNARKNNVSSRATKRSAAKQRLEKKFAVKIGEDSVLFDDKQNPKAFLTQKDEEVKGTQDEGYSRPRRKLFFLKQNGEVKKSIDIKTYEESIIKKGDSPSTTQVSRISEKAILAQNGNLIVKLTDNYTGSEYGLRTGGRGETHLVVYDGDGNVLCERDFPKNIFTGGVIVSDAGDAFALAFGGMGKKGDDGKWMPKAEAWLEFYNRRCGRIGEYRKSGYDALGQISVVENNNVSIKLLRFGGDEGDFIDTNILLDFRGNILREGKE